MHALPPTLAAILLSGCFAANSPFSRLADVSREGDVAAIRQLVAHGADPNAPSGGNTWTPLHHAIHKHQTASVDALLDVGADPNRRAGSVTPLMMAAGYGYDDIVALLLARGADPALRGEEGGSALDWALTGTSDIDDFTLFHCQDSTVALLHRAAPEMKPTALSRRAAAFKRCASVAMLR